jgi:hypothetical protein
LRSDQGATMSAARPSTPATRISRCRVVPSDHHTASVTGATRQMALIFARYAADSTTATATPNRHVNGSCNSLTMHSMVAAAIVVTSTSLLTATPRNVNCGRNATRLAQNMARLFPPSRRPASQHSHTVTTDIATEMKRPSRIGL